MTSAARAWLPDNALGLDRARAVLEPGLAGWARRWLGEEVRLGVGSVGACEPPAEPRTVRIAGADGRLAILLPPRGKRALLEALCGVDLAAVSLGPNDHALIDAMTTEIAEDLIAALGAGDPARDADDTRLGLGLKLNGREFLTVEVPRAWFAARARALVPAVRTRLPRLARRRVAIGDSPVAIDAKLGRGSLSLAELRSLAPGDVVVLDRTVAEGVELVIAASSRGLAQGALGRDGAKPTIRL